MDFERDYILRLIQMMGDLMRRIAELMDDAERGAIRGARSFRTDVTDQIGDLFGLGVALQQRRRPAFAEGAQDQIFDGCSHRLRARGQPHLPYA